MKLSEALLKLSELDEGILNPYDIKIWLGSYGHGYQDWQEYLCSNRDGRIQQFRYALERIHTPQDFLKAFRQMVKDKKIRVNTDPATIMMKETSKEIELTWVNSTTKKQCWLIIRKDR